jgi:hypothetical protein
MYNSIKKGSKRRIKMFNTSLAYLRDATSSS